MLLARLMREGARLRRTSTRAAPARSRWSCTARSRRRRCRRARPISSSPTPCSCSTAEPRRRRADPRPAPAQGRAPPRPAAGGRLAARRARWTRGAALSLRYAPGRAAPRSPAALRAALGDGENAELERWPARREPRRVQVRELAALLRGATGEEAHGAEAPAAREVVIAVGRAPDGRPRRRCRGACAARHRRRARHGRARTAPGCSKSRPPPTAAACARRACCRTPAPG